MSKTAFPSIEGSSKSVRPGESGTSAGASRAGPAGVSTAILRPRRERARLIGKVCDRLFGDLDGAVVALARVIESRAGHPPPPPEAAASGTEDPLKL